MSLTLERISSSGTHKIAVPLCDKPYLTRRPVWLKLQLYSQIFFSSSGLRKFLPHGNQNGQNKGTPFIHHDMGTTSGHDVANLMHNLGVYQQYGGYGHGNSHEEASSHGDALYRRRFTDVHNVLPYTKKQRSARMDEPRFTTTGNPQQIRSFHYAGLTKSLVVSA